ncbi:antitoxin [Streptomyces sp. NBC_00190]|uniref:antitoxin n=1 Tax=unclassified Streptomyces TaxID=2593676 RepID=UPI002E280BB7|nr:antitoxin [Streptomyces sp. NBC_00190]WSZ44414.1 antitoxin [Streptomyces sp. NBC_00868]
MSALDKLKKMLKGHEDQSSQAIDKSGDFVDEKTQSKYSSQVDTAQEALKQQLNQDREERPPQT